MATHTRPDVKEFCEFIQRTVGHMNRVTGGNRVVIDGKALKYHWPSALSDYSVHWEDCVRGVLMRFFDLKSSYNYHGDTFHVWMSD